MASEIPFLQHFYHVNITNVVFIKTTVKINIIDMVTMTVKWTIQCVSSSLCGIAKRSCKYWGVIKQAIRCRTGIDFIHHSVPKNYGITPQSGHGCFLPNPFPSVSYKIFGAAQWEVLTDLKYVVKENVSHLVRCRLLATQNYVPVQSQYKACCLVTIVCTFRCPTPGLPSPLSCARQTMD